MNEIETKHGAVKVYRAGQHTYLRTSSYGPIVDPAPELIEGQQVRLSIDEARIIGKALLRCVAEAEEHLEVQSKLVARRKGKPLVDELTFGLPPGAERDALILQREREKIERFMQRKPQQDEQGRRTDTRRRLRRPSEEAELNGQKCETSEDCDRKVRFFTVWQQSSLRSRNLERDLEL